MSDSALLNIKLIDTHYILNGDTVFVHGLEKGKHWQLLEVGSRSKKDTVVWGFSQGGQPEFINLEVNPSIPEQPLWPLAIIIIAFLIPVIFNRNKQ